MGVDCNILLPNDVRVRDVAKAIGILMGGKATRDPFHNDPRGGWEVLVLGVQVLSLSISATSTGSAGEPWPSPRSPTSPFVECVEIKVDFEAQDGKQHWVLFHFEVSGTQGKRLLSPPSTPLWCAVGTALVNFFGGHVDYNDCDDETTGPQRTVFALQRNDPSDDPEWTALQERLMALRPLTAEDIKAHRKVAAWKDPA